MSANESEPLIVGRANVQGEAQTQETKVYSQRFYILAATVLVGFCQGWIWNTFGPIQGPAEHVFNWNDSTIALLANWGPIAYVLTVVFFSWLMDTKGLRWSVLLTAGLTLVGAGIRCASMEPVTATWLNHIGLFLNGMAGPVAMAVGPLVSAVWFPPGQRTTSTAATSLSTYYGLAFSFVIGPVFVPSYKKYNMTSNCTYLQHK